MATERLARMSAQPKAGLRLGKWISLAGATMRNVHVRSAGACPPGLVMEHASRASAPWKGGIIIRSATFFLMSNGNAK
jgi:hypothetical protein